MDLTPQIETYLLSRGDWVHSREICERFGVTDRQLRSVAGRPGLCTRIAISGHKGFKHISLATTAEKQEGYAKERKHAIMELVNARIKYGIGKHVTRQTQHPDLRFERDTGQILLAGVP